MKEVNGQAVYQIGVLIGNVYSRHPAEVVQGIFAASKDKPIDVTFFCGAQNNSFMEGISKSFTTNRLDYSFNTAYDLSLYGNLDAMIISYGTISLFTDDKDKQAFFEKFSHVPHVSLEDESSYSSASLISDNYNGIIEVMNHLIEVHGYKKILFIRGPLSNSGSSRRCTAYKDAMRSHNLVVDDSMILVGDYTQYMVDDVVEFLDRHPDAEAICCANDEMALACYEACQKKGLVVGKDIAVTGYDYSSLASCLDPVLSSVEQNGYEMGYKALMKALNLCAGRAICSELLPARYINGGSCGCRASSTMYQFPDLDKNVVSDNLPAIVEYLSDRIVLFKENQYVKRECDAFLLHFTNYVVERIYLARILEPFDVHWPQVRTILRDLMRSDIMSGISPDNMASYLCEFLVELSGWEADSEKILLFFKLQRKVQDYIRNSTKHHLLDVETETHKRNWVGPLYIRSMMASKYHEKSMYTDALLGLRQQNIRSAYIFIYEKPVMLKNLTTWQCPAKFELAGYMTPDTIQAYSPGSRPTVTRESGYAHLLKETGLRYAAFSLFFQNIQYGFMLAELDPYDLLYSYALSFHLSTGIHYLELSKKEHTAQQIIKGALKQLQNKNQVLKYTSRSDPLTGLMNRSGFVESALELHADIKGETAYFLLADLDHLKQINDTFGHTEGDYAIRSVGHVLKNTLGDHSIVARIGGDEFIALLYHANDEVPLRMRAQITAEFKRHNDSSMKPFWVECSLGIYPFTVGEKLDIAALIKEADSLMYEAKKKRRESVIRDDDY